MKIKRKCSFLSIFGSFFLKLSALFYGYLYTDHETCYPDITYKLFYTRLILAIVFLCLNLFNNYRSTQTLKILKLQFTLRMLWFTRVACMSLVDTTYTYATKSESSNPKWKLTRACGKTHARRWLKLVIS